MLAATTVAAVCATVPAGAQQLLVALRPRDPAALAKAATAISTPGSPEFHRYLSVAQFAARFGAPRAALDAVSGVLRAHGLHVAPAGANRLSVTVSGSARALRSALGPRALRLRVARTHGRPRPTPGTATERVLRRYVQAVIDLDPSPGTRRKARAPVRRAPRARRRASRRGLPGWARKRRARPHAIGLGPALSGGPQPCAAASGAVRPSTFGPGWTANQIAYAYDFGPLYRAGDKGQGVTVALYEQEPELRSDVAAFERCYGTRTQVSYVRVGRGSGTGAGTGEATGDIDQLISLAPKARVIVYNGPANSPGASDPILEEIVSQDRARVISSSWGDCEPEEGRAAATVDNNLLEEAAIQGQTFVTASGDDGAEDCYAPGSDHDRAVTVDSPSSSPWATAVGGTLLRSLAPLRETVWNNARSGNVADSGITPGASGGGISRFWQMPAYQAQAPSTLGVVGPRSSGAPCRAPVGGWCREVPDVSASADPMEGYSTLFEGQWQTWGGTSAAAPVWAALFALADAAPGCAAHPVGFVNPALYALAGHAFVNGRYDAYFNDVTSGDNDLLGVNHGAFPAGPGYDMASGLGTPRAAQIVAGLCAQTLRIHPIAGERVMRAGEPLNVQLRVTAPPAGVTAVSFHARGLPSGLRLAAASGLISGEPRAPGRYTVSFWATGSAQTVAPAIRAVWVVRPA